MADPRPRLEPGDNPTDAVPFSAEIDARYHVELWPLTDSDGDLHVWDMDQGEIHVGQRWVTFHRDTKQDNFVLAGVGLEIINKTPH